VTVDCKKIPFFWCDVQCSTFNSWRAKEFTYHKPGFKHHERVGMKYNAVYDYVKITVLRYISIVKKT
jgi:hypothetical protein